jgi:5-methylcytosine-specific restriction endonuclease McrA
METAHALTATPRHRLEAVRAKARGGQVGAPRRDRRERPRQKPRPSKPDHLPAHVRREVWRRDGGRCQWKLANGEICGCTRHLQLDHVKPLALGGTSTVDNVRILCRSHHLEAARLVFGDPWMDRYTERPSRRRFLAWSGDRAAPAPSGVERER